MSSKIGDNMTKFRRRTGMSIAQVADFMSVTPDEVIDWEEGNREPTNEQLIKLASLYGLKSENEFFEEGNSFKFDFATKNSSEYQERRRRAKLWNKFPYSMVCVLAYLILGFCINPAENGFSGWHPGWLIFLTIPLYHGAVSAITYHRGNRFPYPILCVLIYLLIGFFANIWTWSLLIFLTVPVYYWLVNGSWKNFWSQFPYAALCVIIYLVLGFALNWWHPGWLIFLTIPIFNSIVSMFRNK